MALALATPTLLGSALANGAGSATLLRAIPLGAQGRTAWFQAARIGEASDFFSAVVN